MAEIFKTFLRIEGRDLPLWRKRMRAALVCSLALHLTTLASILFIPALRDMFNVASTLAGAEYVNEEYQRTKIERATVIQLLSDRFQYPPGYFAKPEPLSQIETVATKRPRPKPRPTVEMKPQPEASPSPSLDPQNLAEAMASEQKAEELLDKQAEEAKIKRPPRINKKPFLDLLLKAKQMMDRGELKLDGTIVMTIEADRRDDGTLENVRITSAQTTDRALYALAEEFVQALSASRALSFLEGARKLRMTLRLDQQRVSVRASTEVESAARAAEMARGYSGLLIVERLRKRGSDEAVIWNNTTVSSQGKEVLVRFEMPRNLAGQMLSKQLPSS
jgi:hypothetical protein